MIENILERVKSPMTNELIQNLIEKYIACGCDDEIFYREINNLGSTQGEDNHFTHELIKKIYSIGIPKDEAWRNEVDSAIFYDRNKSWTVISSNEDPMNDRQRMADKKILLLYRIYLNLKGEEKLNFVLNYLDRCQSEKIPFEIKFSNDDSRTDQIVILSNIENFEKNFNIVEELTKDANLGEIPMLIGEHKNGIGIAEEYYNRLYSPTQVKLALVRTSIKKYLCDHKGEIYSQLKEKEKSQIDEYIEEFSYLYDEEINVREVCKEEYEDWQKSYYQKMSTINRTQEYIDDNSSAYCCSKGLLELGNAISQIYSNNSEQFMEEIIQNYKMIATQVWGFSHDLLFSNETEEKFLKKESEKNLTAEEIGYGLEIVSRKGLLDETQIELINIIDSKDNSIEQPIKE